MADLLPDIALAATDGTNVNLRRVRGLVVLFCYPWSGRPGHADPPGWDAIPGAHGSTPQAARYAALWPRFQALSASVFGMSLQSSDWQQEFARRLNLPFVLLSDSERVATRHLGLATFRTGDADYLVRTSFVAQDGAILLRRHPQGDPATDADQVLAMLERLAR
jgi:peroxiredoxin